MSWSEAVRFGLGLGLMALVARSGRQSPEPGPDAEVKAFITDYIETLQSGDEEAIRALFVSDGRFEWFTDGALSYASVEEVLAGLRRYEGIRFETALREVRVVPLGPRLASVRSHFRTKLSIPGSSDHEYGGVITWLVEKDPASGAWRVLLGHTSTPGGPPRGGEEPR